MNTTPLHELTEEGVERALEFLAGLRENPAADRTPPDELLSREPYSRRFDDAILVEPRTFRTRREAGEYFSSLLRNSRHLVADHAGVWSWLGMYYFPEIVRVENGQVKLHDDTTSLFLGGREAQRRYRHYLWSAWRLYEQHGESVAFMLNRPLTDSGDITKFVLDYPRVFNSAGVPALIVRLYTDGDSEKRGFSVRPGNLGHLINRTLPQLELTYDVYGMEPDALLEVLPPAFQEWAST